MTIDGKTSDGPETPARDPVEAAGAALTVVLVDAATTRSDVATLARSVGRVPARYVIDDRNGSIISMLEPTGLASAIVYDARGRIVARPAVTRARLARVLRRAGAQ